MKRLIDDTELPPDALRLAELVRQAEPFHPSASGKRRVSLRLREPVRSGYGFRAPTLGAALLVIGAATAAAAVGYRWVAIGSRPAATSSPAPAAPTPAEVRRHQPAPAAEPAAAPAAGAPLSEPAPRSAPPQRGRALAARPKAPGEDPAPVLDAIRALRKSRDPARAQKLLDAYLASNPRGALSEDALGLAIEAAAARRDPRASDYAKRYLALFPNGRFRAVALRAAGR